MSIIFNHRYNHITGFIQKCVIIQTKVNIHVMSDKLFSLRKYFYIHVTFIDSDYFQWVKTILNSFIKKDIFK